MIHSRITPNQPLDKAISARTYNEMVDFLNRGGHRAGGNVPEFDNSNQHSIISVRNNTAGNLAPYDLVVASAPTFTPTANLRAFQETSTIDVVAPTSTSRGSFFVMLTPCKPGQIAFAMVSGVTCVKINIVHSAHDRADLTTLANLVSGFAGSAEILWKESGTGVKWAIIRWPILDYGVILATADANITTGSSGTVSVYRNGADSGANETAWLTWMHGGQLISANKQLKAEWFKDQRKWIITGAECES